MSAKQTASTPQFAGDVDAFSEDAAAGEEGAVDPAPGGVDAVGELAQDLAPLGDEVVAAQPCRPHAVRGYVAACLQLVELRVDRGLRQLVRGGQVLVGGVVDVQLGSGLRQLVRERRGFLHLLVERHDGTQVVRGGVLRSAVCSSARRRPRRASSDSPSTGRGRGSRGRRSRTRQGFLAQSPPTGPVRRSTPYVPVRIVGHGRELHLLAARCPSAAGARRGCAGSR